MKPVLHIFILLAFVLGIIAPACGFAWGGKYSVVEICTLDGIESRVVENEQKEHAPSMGEDCAFCFASTNVKNFLPNHNAVEKIHFSAEKIRFRQFEIVYLSHTSKSDPARAPPTSI